MANNYRITFFIFVIAFMAVLFSILQNTRVVVNTKKRIRIIVENLLIMKKPDGNITGWRQFYPTKSAIYILGGNHKSLKHKFLKAGDLYMKGWAKKVLVLNSNEKTLYDPKIGRNLTENEWSIKQLSGLGIEPNDIELIKIKSGFFGTLSEAKTLGNLVYEERIGRLLLVCSSYHSKRVWVTFTGLLHDNGLTIEIYSVDERMRLSSLFVEYGKLVLYEHLLIPYKIWINRKK